MAYRTINPANNELINEYPYISDKELNTRLERSKDGFDYWKNTSFKSRKGVLQDVADLLAKEREKHANVITLEMGKPVKQSLAEVDKCAWACRYYAEHGESFLYTVEKESTAKSSLIQYEPPGIIFAIMPWNFPYWQVFRYIAPNLMAGNAGLLKHASNVPKCAEEIESVFLRAGLKEGVFQNLFVRHDQIETVIAYRGVRGVTLTGSNKAGSVVAGLAGKYLKKSVLELGGSDPFIICRDAQLKSTVEMAVASRFQNTGQSCIAAKRFLVEDGIYNDFTDQFLEKVKKLKVGNPMEMDTDLGPLARKDLAEELDGQVRETIRLGADCLTGGKRGEINQNYYLPTVLVNIPEDTPVVRQEVFGPVAPVQRFSDIKACIEMANNTIFGLGASVWTQDIEKAGEIAKKIYTGTVAINGMVKSEPAVPFGGVNDSGYGRELSDMGIREFVNAKAVNYY
jgi:succinate-semialdehyde dehydrogenase / glutarate-semialdehyde dehydrogenase